MEESAARRRVAPKLRVVQTCAALNATGSKYLVVGGVACVLHGHVRATADLDILIDPSLENARKVLAALATQGYGFARDVLAEEIIKKPITVIGDDPAVDIFLVAWMVKYRTAVRRAESVVLGNVTIPFVCLDDLIASKRTGRLQDAADIEVLEAIRRRV